MNVIPQARAACLAYHGYTCKICGMSFEKTYGPEFKDIIEVHHIVPLNQIGEAYVVDPMFPMKKNAVFRIKGP